MASMGQDHELKSPKTENGDGLPWSREDLTTSKLARETIEYTFCGSWKALHAGKWDDFHKLKAKNVDSELLLLNDEELTRDWKEFQATFKDHFDSYQERKLPDHALQPRRSGLQELLPRLGDLLWDRNTADYSWGEWILEKADIESDYWNWIWLTPEQLISSEDPYLRDSALSDLQIAWKTRNQFHLEFLVDPSNPRTL